MALVYTYPDAYLSRFCTEAVETRAISDVALLGDFPAAWKSRLAIVQAYIIVCLENQADMEDLFSAKLKNYRQQLQILLPQAQAAEAAANATTIGFGMFSVPLERA